jgi:hypothetical protein
MASATDDFDPYLSDPDHWGFSLVHLSELILACLNTTEAKLVAEVGAFAGDLTRVLMDWAVPTGARVLAVDPSPQEQLIALARVQPQLELIRQTSLEALPRIPVPDVVIIDGDHNYYTVTQELHLIRERAGAAKLPLLLLHDVCWPHARRDDYFDVERLPKDARHPTAGSDGGIFPGDRGLRPDGLPYPRSAAHQGGPRNGVLTAVEDFVASSEGLRLAVVPAFFGLGAVWSEEAQWAESIAQVLGPWDRSPLLEHLEANRIHQLAQAHSWRVKLWGAQERQARYEGVLRRLLDSSAFALADRLSRLRVRVGIAADISAVSKDEVRRALTGSNDYPPRGSFPARDSGLRSRRN